MTNGGGGRNGTSHLSWQHTAIYASADVAKLLLISGGFVASMYIWRETRGPLCAFLPSVGLAEAATNLQYYYDRDNPQNIKKRCWSIAGVAVVGLGYLLIDEAKRLTAAAAAAADATGLSSALCEPSSSTAALSAVVGHAAKRFFSLSFSATTNVIKTYFVNPRLIKDVASATLVTSTLFAGVIATKIFFPRERDLMPDCSSSSENEEEEGEEDSYAKKDGLDNFNFDATRESSPTDRHQPTPRAGLGLGAAGSAGSRADLASFGGGWGGGRPRSTYASMDEMGGGGGGGYSITTSHNYSGTNIAHYGEESPRSRVGGVIGAPGSNTRASTASRPLRVAREVSRELRGLRERRRKWKILRNLVFAPFVEEIVFRAVMIRVLDNSVVTYPSFVRYLLLGFGFSIAHTHHIVLYAVRSYQNNFDPLEDEEEQSRNAWESGAKATLAQVVVTGVFTYLNTFIFTSVAHNNVIAAFLSHAFCNYLGPPSLAYQYYPPTELSSRGEERDKTQLDEGGANKKLKKAGKKGIIFSILRGLKRVFRPSRVEHSLKIKLITTSYGAGVVGFFGLIFAYRRQALGK